MFSEARAGAPRVALVGCSARKLHRRARARDFYTSALFRAAVAYAEGTCDAVRVVSALYGAVKLDAWLEPYDRSLLSFRKTDREGWGVRTVAEVIGEFSVPPVLVILAGEVYADALVYGAHWHNLPRPEEPLRGIKGCGARVRWLAERTPASTDDENIELRQTFDTLYRAHGAAVRRKLKRLGVDAGDLDELHQEVFMVALGYAGEAPANPRAWLCGIARKLAANHRRLYRHVFEVRDDDAMKRFPASPGVAELMRNAMGQLGDAERDLILRHDVNGETITSIARELGQRPSAVYRRLREARLKLRG